MRTVHSDWEFLIDYDMVQKWGMDLHQTLENLARQFPLDDDGIPLRVLLETPGEGHPRLVMVRKIEGNRWLYYTASTSPLEFSRKARTVHPIPAQNVPRYPGNFTWSVFPSIYSNDRSKMLRPYHSVVSYIMTNFRIAERENDGS